MYGLQLNWNKLDVLPVRCEARIKKPNGDYVVSKESLLYLGSFLCDNGSIGPELNRQTPWHCKGGISNIVPCLEPRCSP